MCHDKYWGHTENLCQVIHTLLLVQITALMYTIVISKVNNKNMFNSLKQRNQLPSQLATTKLLNLIKEMSLIAVIILIAIIIK